MRWMQEQYGDDAEGKDAGWVTMVDGRPIQRPLPTPLDADALWRDQQREARRMLDLPPWSWEDEA
jgi:hypothetical protein